MKIALLLVVGLFDLAIGIVAVFYPESYMAIMHSSQRSVPLYFLQRTGTTWIFFSFIAGLAILRREKNPEWTTVFGFLNLMEAPADWVYLMTADHLTQAGKWILTTMIPIDLLVGFAILRLK